MFKPFQNKKRTILCIVLAAVLAAGTGVLVWQLVENFGTHTVTFVTNGGKELEAMKVDDGTVLPQSELPVPSKQGEMFLAWYLDEALTEPYWDTPIERDTVLYASYLKPTDTAKTNELVESVIPYAQTDFSVTVCSSVELTNENIGQYVILTVNYGHHETGEEIRLSVASEGNGIYRLSANFAEGGEYIISLVSDAVTFNPEDPTLTVYGLTDALRTLQLRIIGDTYMNGELSDQVAHIPQEDIQMLDGDSVTVSGDVQNLIGPTENDNGIIRVGEDGELSNYYKIVAVESTDGNATTYTVRPARIEEVYDRVFGYQWHDLGADDFVINEEVKQQVLETLVNNEQLNNYITYLATAATYTPTYQTMSRSESGGATVTPMVTVLTPTVSFDVDMSAYNDKFVHIIGEDKSGKFVKLTVGANYGVKLGKLGSAGNMEAEISMEVSLWVFVGVGGNFEIGWGEYDIDCGSTTLTQTEISFGITLMTADAKKKVDITDEIEAIYNSAKDPTPENLLNQYSELLNGDSTPIELFNEEIFDVPVLSLLYGAVEISIPVRFVVSLDIQASFSSYFTVLNGNDFGIQGNEDSGLRIICNSMTPRYKLRLELRGRMELRAGLELGFKLSLAYDLASVSMNVQVGVYGELHGYFFYEVDHLNSWYDPLSTQGGAYYYEIGVYVEINLRAQVCKIKYKGGLWEAKDAFCEGGTKEIVYGFVNPTTDVVTLDGRTKYLHLTDTDILDVYIFDITKPRGDNNPRIATDYPFAYTQFQWNFSTDDFDVYQDAIWCTGNYNYNTAFEATLVIHYTGVQLSFRDTLTKYVTVRCSRVDDTDWDKLGETVSVDFTVNGQVIFTRELPYGARIGMHRYNYYRMWEDGTESYGELTESEAKAIRKAGLEYVSWNVWDHELQFATEPTAIEAEKSVIRKTFRVTLTEDSGEETVITVNAGEKILLPFPEKSSYTTAKYAYQAACWKDEEGKCYSFNDLHTITGDLTLTPEYTKTLRKYYVTLDGNGGTVDGTNETFTRLYYYGDMPSWSFTPQREGGDGYRYEFVGWSNGWDSALSPVTEEVTYYAQWKRINYYTITFYAGDGQFDAAGTKSVSITLDEGHVLTENDFPTDPYKLGDGGYYELDHWTMQVGGVIKRNITCTAIYNAHLILKTGITISDGRTTEDIAAFLDGTNKISGYSYTLNTEFYGNVLEITAPGLTVSGEASDINIRVSNTEVTLEDLKLVQNQRIEVISATGNAAILIRGTVELTSNTDREGIRGDNHGVYDPVNGGYVDYADANIILRGVSSNSKLIVNGQAYGIAVYGALTVDNLQLTIHMPTTNYTDPEEGWVYDVVALQVHNHPKGILTVTGNSNIVINGGVVNVAWLDMTDSEMLFGAKEFVPGTYCSGLHIMNYYELTGPETLIKLTNSRIAFNHEIAISIVVSLPGENPDDSSDDVFYMVNTSLEEPVIMTSYVSLDDFLADVAANGYSEMVELDADSSIT